MKPSDERRDSFNHRGSALVSTLLVVLILSIIVVAFMQSMTAERQAARSYKNRFQAEIAAAAATTDAIERLKAATATDTYSVIQTNFLPPDELRAAPPIFFIAQLANAAGATPPQVTFTPLVSGGKPAVTKNAGALPTSGEIFDSTFPDATGRDLRPPSFTTKYYSGKLPEARWVPLTDDKGNRIARYAFWVEDLQGRLDATQVGNQRGAGSSHVRGERLGQADRTTETALFTLFDKDTREDDGSTNAGTVIDNRAALFSPPTIKQFLTTTDSSESDADDPELTLYPALGFESDAPEVIPPGFGLPRAGQPKVALNDLLGAAAIDAANAVQGISAAISDNLPAFAGARAGGMDPGTYVRTLAASIIDYADANNQATTDGTTYRGLDSYPLVSQWFMATGYTQRSATSATFVNRHFIEVWNLSDKVISGSVRFAPVNGYTIVVGGTTLNFAQPAESITVLSVVPDVPVTLQPNQKQVLDVGTVTFTVPTSSIPPASISAGATSLSDYTMSWRESGSPVWQVVDRAGVRGGTAGVGKVYGVGKSFEHSNAPVPNGNTDWNASIAGFIYRGDNPATFLNGHLGDPRAAYYLRNAQDQNSYDSRVTLGGRTLRWGLGSFTYGEARPSTWPDPGFDDALPGAANRITSTATLPTSPPVAPSNPLMALAHYGNYADGKLRSITELGHVYDPGQWQQYANQPNQTAWAGVASGLADISSSAVPNARYGGGYTLRIGRPEFSRFAAAPGADAANLLAVFSTEKTTSTRGLLNINTASRDALRALGAGITMNAPRYDPTNYNAYSVPASISGPVKSPTDRVEADAFADAVLASRPFYSAHELATRLKNTSGEVFWGNPRSYHSAERPTVWRDAAAEEYFRQIYDLVTVRSRNFRIHVTGQTLNPTSGKPVSTYRRMMDVYLAPKRNPAGTITGFDVRPLYEIAP